MILQLYSKDLWFCRRIRKSSDPKKVASSIQIPIHDWLLTLNVAALYSEDKKGVEHDLLSYFMSLLIAALFLLKRHLHEKLRLEQETLHAS